MDYMLYLLLFSAAFILGIANSVDSCNEDNCNSSDADTHYMDSLDPDLRELHLDGCSNLTLLELTPNLRTLEIFNCSWESIKINELSVVANLTYLQMRGGRLSELATEQFVQLPYLEVLKLGANNIRVVSQDTFKGVSQLLMLTLNDNRIVILPENLFYPLPKLRHLDLSNNRINGLPDSIFANNPKLEVLALRYTSFLRLQPKALEPLKNLIFLDLSSNYFRRLQLHGAETIRLENTGIHNLSIQGKFSKLQARHNYLEDLQIEHKDPVTELDLHENDLETDDLSDVLQGMWRLQRLDISRNLLKELPIFPSNKLGEVLLLPSLRFVNISRNRLMHLRADSPLLSPSLTHLDLSYNKIRSIEPHTFSMASKLQSLHIEKNRLWHFQYDLFHKQQPGLQEVALYDNEFSHDIYEKISNYFTQAGVLVLEKITLNASKMKSPIDFISDTEMLIRRVHQKKESIEPSADQHIFIKWRTWNVLIFLSLLAALTLNAILIRQHLRSSGRKAWRRKQSSKIKARLVKIKDSEI